MPDPKIKLSKRIVLYVRREVLLQTVRSGKAFDKLALTFMKLYKMMLILILKF